MLPQKPFYLIRHGESLANVGHITGGGRFDSPLSPLGHEQAKRLAPLIDQLEVKPGHLYHSPLQRAYNTAKYLNAALNLPATSEDNLREQDFGDWDGLPWQDVLPQLDAGIAPPGGESLSVFAHRIQAMLTDIFNRGNETPPLVVAHGGLFFALGSIYAYGMTQIQNCHLHYFEPHTPYTAFPWKVSMFDIEGGRLVKKPAPFCMSQTVRKIAV
jgi:broad specificity phosphatase PhoE